MTAPHRHERLDVGVVGAGVMGTGIAELLACAGHTVLLHDVRSNAANEGRSRVIARLDRRVREGRMASQDRAAVADRLRTTRDLAELSPCGLVIEAIAEDLEAKRHLFGELAEIVAADAILASNTSSLPIGAIAAGLATADRVAGLHFFNPAPVMKLVEVIPGPETRPEVIERLVSLVRNVGHEPVRTIDAPGFLVNFGGRAFLTEGLAVLQERVATPAEIDAIMRDCWGFRMGPFELMDLTGMDVNLPVTEFIHRRSFGDPRLRSTALHRYMYETGQLGRKTGRGYYDYGEGVQKPSPDYLVDVKPAAAVALAEVSPKLSELLGEVGVEILASDDGCAPMLCAPLGEDCSAFCARTGTDHRRMIAVDVLGETGTRVTLMSAPGVDPMIRDSVAALFSSSRHVTLIADSPGFVGQRIAAMVANLGCEMAQTGLGSPDEIDTAMRLGLNYPNGPLELGDGIGSQRLFEVLRRIQELTGDDRYRPSQWLRRRAQLGLPVRCPS